MSDLSKIEYIRQSMPATTAHMYLNTGTFGPLPECALQAMQEHMQRDWQQGRMGYAAFEAISQTYGEARQGAARLIHADVDEIALTDSTGDGLNIIVAGIDWRAGDEVITTNHEHFSLTGPLQMLRRRHGVEIRVADIGERGELPVLKAIADLVTPRTRLIALSHVSWMTGALLNVAEVGYMGREWGIPVLIDGAQSAGAIPIDAHALGVDFYAIPMQKWLCGADGTGVLYARRESLAYVQPACVGYFSFKHEENSDWELHEGAQRFEMGGRQTAAIAAQAANFKWLEENIGYDWLYRRVASLHSYAFHALQEVPGLTMLTPHPGESGLLAFTLAGKDEREVVSYLWEQHNISIRSIPENHALRVSTGFYNTEEEIDTLARALRKM